MTTKLKQIRLDFNLTQEELGKKVGVSKQTIQRIENCKRKPSYDLMLRLADVLNIPGDELLQDVDNSSFSRL